LPNNIAPEILNDLGYDTKADIFSAGVILYTLLSGLSPFYGRNYEEVLSKNKLAHIEYPESIWGNVSAYGKELVMDMLEIDQYKRPSAEECLAHKWFATDGFAESTNSLAAAIENIKKYSLQY
jgi:serine/threonine protein kinase